MGECGKKNMEGGGGTGWARHEAISNLLCPIHPQNKNYTKCLLGKIDVHVHVCTCMLGRTLGNHIHANDMPMIPSSISPPPYHSPTTTHPLPPTPTHWVLALTIFLVFCCDNDFRSSVVSSDDIGGHHERLISSSSQTKVQDLHTRNNIIVHDWCNKRGVKLRQILWFCTTLYIHAHCIRWLTPPTCIHFTHNNVHLAVYVGTYNIIIMQ